MRYRYWLILLAMGPATALAWGDCEFRADRSAGVDAKGVEKVVIRAGAGDMKVVGRGNAVRIEARGVACAAKQELLDRTNITVRREGNVVYVETDMPQNDDNRKWMDNEYAFIDLGVALPSNLPVETTDSSGDAVFEDLHALQLQDSSGDLEISRINGLADVNDSSGDIDIDSAGSVRLRDSSGDLELDDIRGDVLVLQDSSGDIHVERVAGSVKVEQDSSGDIRVQDVKGSFVVDSDSSGSIYAMNINGDFTVGDDSSGEIEHESIGGKVTIPADKRDDEDVER
jgi:DUF4097 and DUF4098 domain-containing protein YvlB